MWVLTNASCKPSLGAPRHVSKFYRPKMGKNWTILNRYISVITNIDEKWLVIFQHTINCLSLGYVRLPQLEYFFFFSYFFFFFSYSSSAIYFVAKCTAFKAGPSPRGGIRGKAPPKFLFAPPKFFWLKVSMAYDLKI